ncbi:MAG: hypothetical protein QME47_01935 [Candidatus Thermoplasmatota archaeon]|nr:hypothetical protein [Candidatus Thermoplasmatota archaeon]
MKVIGILTKKFPLYYELIKALKQKNLSFESLEFGKKIPSRIGVVITSRQESKVIKFKNKVIAGNDLESTVEKACGKLIGLKYYDSLVIGIDPGEKPGIAAIANEKKVKVAQAQAPEDVAKIVKKIAQEYPANRKLIRIGYGARLLRNRIINKILNLKIPIELVDETSTTKRGFDRDIRAAIEISMRLGKAIPKDYSFPKVKPTLGELKEIQSKARTATGILTISRKLADKVAKGEMSLEEAISKSKKES